MLELVTGHLGHNGQRMVHGGAIIALMVHGGVIKGAIDAINGA